LAVKVLPQITISPPDLPLPLAALAPSVMMAPPPCQLLVPWLRTKGELTTSSRPRLVW
jgi:hypothetical protein